MASIGFAADAVHREVSTGEPAIRGLVHAAIGGLFVILLWHGNTLAQTFGVYALVGAAFGVDDEILAVFMLVAATEAVVHHQVVPVPLHTDRHEAKVDRQSTVSTPWRSGAPMLLTC